MNNTLPPLQLTKYLYTKTSRDSLLPTPPISPDVKDSPITTLATSHQSALPDSSSRDAEKQAKRQLDNDHERRKKARRETVNMQLLDLYLASGKPMHVQDDRYGLNLLCWACHCRSLEAVQHILHRAGGQFDINQRHGPSRLTALQIAASVGFSAALDLLTSHPDLDVNVTDARGWTALHHVVRRNDLEGARVLLDAGARLDLLDLSGRLALHHAVRTASHPLIALLLHRSYERNNPSRRNLIWSSCPFVLEEAIMLGNLDVLQDLALHGALDPTRWWERRYEAKQRGILSLCVYWNRPDCLRTLVAADVLVGRQRALELAVQQRKIDLVRYLRRDVAVEPCRLDGSNPSFLYAVRHGFVDMIPLLLTSETSSDCLQQARIVSAPSDLINRDCQDLQTLNEAFENILNK
ncbi:MAG: ankyrin repeat-containing domain protein [Benjaminiella poitrasii]|nr:MAG: ankyrin repeat-containing domain protein [Benjaminiella poitrasii]